MALLFMESFDHYATADLLTKWATLFAPDGPTAAISASNGRHGSSSLRLPIASSNTRIAVVRPMGGSGAVVIVGLAVRYSAAAGTNSCSIAALWDGGNIVCSLRLNQDNTLSVTRGDHTATLLGSTSGGITLNQFAFIEWKMTLSTSAGTVDVRIDGISRLSLTGVNTTNTGSPNWTSLELGQRNFTGAWSGALNVDYDDLYVLDGTGAAPWNAFLGDCRVDVRNPTGAGATTGWTPSAGSNWQNVDDATPNGDTDYNSAAAANLTDTFVVQDAPSVGSTIYGVQHCLNMKKVDAGACSIAPIIRHSGTDYPGANLNPSQSYACLTQIAATNPGTSAQWVEADFNNAEFGYKRTA